MKNAKLTYGIIGLGRFGTALAYKLSALGADVMVADQDENKVAELREVTENAYIANVLDKKNLESMGFRSCDVVVVCIGGAIDVSILTVMKLQALGVPRIIAKANSAEHGEILKKLGVEIVFPERDMALRLANRMEMGHGMDFIELSDSVKVATFGVPEFLVGKTVLEGDLRGRFGLNIIAIENGGQVVDAIRPDYVFRGEDTLFLCGNKNAIFALSDWMERQKQA